MEGEVSKGWGEWDQLLFDFLPLSTYPLQLTFGASSFYKRRNAFLSLISLFSLLVGTEAVWVKSAAETQQEKGLTPSSRMLSLPSVAQAPGLPSSEASSCHQAPQSSAVCFQHNVFLWMALPLSLSAELMQSQWGGTTITHLAGTWPSSLYKAWVLCWAPSQPLCLLQAIYYYSKSLLVNNL